MDNIKKNWKYIKWACRFGHTPNANELYGKKLHTRCFYNCANWSEAPVCHQIKNCPLLND